MNYYRIYDLFTISKCKYQTFDDEKEFVVHKYSQWIQWIIGLFCKRHKKVTPPHVEPILQGQTKGTDKSKKLSLKTKIAEKDHGYYFWLSVQWRHNNKIDGLRVDCRSLL